MFIGLANPSGRGVSRDPFEVGLPIRIAGEVPAYPKSARVRNLKKRKALIHKSRCLGDAIGLELHLALDTALSISKSLRVGHVAQLPSYAVQPRSHLLRMFHDDHT